MSEKIYLVRDSELQAMIASAVSEILSDAMEDVVASGVDLSLVEDLKNAIQNQLEQDATFSVVQPSAPVADSQKEDFDGDTTADTLEPEIAEDSTDELAVEIPRGTVQLDKKSIFEELKGLR